MRRGLPPLQHRRTRVTLLLGSYLDAVEAPRAVEGEGGAGPSAGRAPARNVELWTCGSYRELERCLSVLYERHPSVHWHTYELHVRRHGGGPVRRRKAERGLEWLCAVMPRDVFVPAAISENAGYDASAARSYERRRAR